MMEVMRRRAAALISACETSCSPELLRKKRGLRKPPQGSPFSVTQVGYPTERSAERRLLPSPRIRISDEQRATKHFLHSHKQVCRFLWENIGPYAQILWPNEDSRGKSAPETCRSRVRVRFRSARPVADGPAHLGQVIGSHRRWSHGCRCILWEIVLPVVRDGRRTA